MSHDLPETMTADETVGLDRVFAKTRSGQDEIQTRSRGLAPMARRLLVLVDGKRSLQELAAFVVGQDVQVLARQLLELGCVEVVASAAPAMPAREPARRAPAAEPQSLDELPPAASRSAQDFEMAANFMINSIRQLMDPVMAAPFVGKIQACRSSADLRGYYPEWAQAVGSGWGGTKRLANLRPRLFEVL